MLLWGESGPEWVAVFLGCALLGVVVVPMDHIAASSFADRVADAEAVSRAAAAGNLEDRDRCLGAAWAPIALADAPAPDGSPPAAHSSEGVRFARRMLARALAEAAVPAAARPDPPPSASGPMLASPQPTS